MRYLRHLPCLLAACLTWAAAGPSHAQDNEGGALQACLAAWGEHPFGANPSYRTLATSVRVFGIGPATADREVTAGPSLIMVNPGVNVMGGSAIELLNPQGWYCLRSAVNVMGGMDIKLHCNARLASSSNGASVMSGENAAKGVSVMGAIKVERVGCSNS